MEVKSESEVAQLCLTLRDPMDCSLPGSCIHGIFQERVLEWVTIAFSVLWLRRSLSYMKPIYGQKKQYGMSTINILIGFSH